MDRAAHDGRAAEGVQPNAGDAQAVRHQRGWGRAAAALLLSAAFHGWLIAGPAGHGGGHFRFTAAAHAQPVEKTFLVQIAQPGAALSVAAPPPEGARHEARSPSLSEHRAEITAAANPGPAISLQPRGSVKPPARYFRSSELDTRPIMMTEVDLDDAAIDKAASGYWLLRLFISELGEVEKVGIVVQDAPRAATDRVVSLFGGARFTPGIKDRAPVKSQMLIEVKLRPQPDR